MSAKHAVNKYKSIRFIFFAEEGWIARVDPSLLPLVYGDVPSLGASVYHPEKRGPQMGRQATLCSPFTNFNMVSVCVGMALGTVASPPLLSSPTLSSSPPGVPLTLHSQIDNTSTHTLNTLHL